MSSPDAMHEYEPEDLPGPEHRAETPNRIVVSPAVRKYLYLGLAAVVAALVVLGLVTQEQVAEWAQLTVAFLTLGTTLLAAANVPPKP